MPRVRNGPGLGTEPGSENFATASTLARAGDGDGLDRAIENAESDWWTQGALTAIRQLARDRRGFTIDDVLDLVGEPTDPHYPGAAFASARRQKVVEAVGARVGRGGRLVRVWWGVAA